MDQTSKHKLEAQKGIVASGMYLGMTLVPRLSCIAPQSVTVWFRDYDLILSSPSQFLSNLRGAGLEAKAQIFEGILQITMN